MASAVPGGVTNRSVGTPLGPAWPKEREDRYTPLHTTRPCLAKGARGPVSTAGGHRPIIAGTRRVLSLEHAAHHRRGCMCDQVLNTLLSERGGAEALLSQQSAQGGAQLVYNILRQGRGPPGLAHKLTAELVRTCGKADRCAPRPYLNAPPTHVSCVITRIRILVRLVHPKPCADCHVRSATRRCHVPLASPQARSPQRAGKRDERAGAVGALSARSGGRPALDWGRRRADGGGGDDELDADRAAGECAHECVDDAMMGARMGALMGALIMCRMEGWMPYAGTA